ncbi:IS66 family insertion sequence element accessory protein TnpA [Desertivirga xinjiangensis]|uniref:IS66 family insertion sequence element accessory protein TnpA n=1 Tax=Desertivirga xinjiangensis TaxID=539206 RepID=UPI00210E83C8|nr:IS66 family insertion sequence element accessory protein TnpB [Pedobacter xinjiangensis]
MKQREEMEAAVKRWRESGLKKKEFCEQQDFSLSTFSYWITRINQSNRKGFVSLSPTVKPESSSSIEIIYPNGVRLKVASTDLKTISQLINLC